MQLDEINFLNHFSDLRVKTDPGGCFVQINNVFEDVLGYTNAELSGTPVTNLFHPEDTIPPRHEIDELKYGNTRKVFLNRVRDKSGNYHYIEWVFLPDEKGYFLASGRDVSERKQIELEKRRTEEFFDIIDACISVNELLRQALSFIKDNYGFDALAVRLQANDGYPYACSIGFNEDFLEKESMIHIGNSSIKKKCFCTMVISGIQDDFPSCFTRHGSFYTGSLKDLIEEKGETGTISCLRSECNENGYETIIILPLRIGTEKIGLIQLNDRRKDLVSAESLRYLERLSNTLAVAVSRIKKSQELLESEKHLQTAQKIAGVGSWVLDPESMFFSASDEMKKIIGYKPQNKRQIHWSEILEGIDDSDRAPVEKAMYDIIGGSNPPSVSFGFTTPDQRHIYIKADAELFKSDIIGRVRVFGTGLDITRMKENEAEITRLLKEKDILLKEVHHRVKNDMNTVKGMLAMNAFNLKESSAREMMKTAESRILSMMVLYDRLYKGSNLKSLNIREYLESLLTEISGLHQTQVSVDVSSDDIILPVKTVTPIGIIINELYANTMKYAFDRQNGNHAGISVSLANRDGYGILNYSDNGRGYSIDNQSEGFGLKLLDMLVKQIRGSYEITSENGASVSISFPIQE